MYGYRVSFRCNFVICNGEFAHDNYKYLFCKEYIVWWYSIGASLRLSLLDIVLRINSSQQALSTVSTNLWLLACIQVLFTARDMCALLDDVLLSSASL